MDDVIKTVISRRTYRRVKAFAERFGISPAEAVEYMLRSWMQSEGEYLFDVSIRDARRLRQQWPVKHVRQVEGALR